LNIEFFGDESISFTATDITVVAGAVHQYTIDWSALCRGEEGVTVQVDSNGDGVFEHTFTSDSELTQSEYAIALDTCNTWMTDSDFNEIDSFGVVFTPYRKTGLYKLTATNPGQFYFNILATNTWSEPRDMNIIFEIDDNFIFKGARPIHVYADLARTIDITKSCIISGNSITVLNVQPEAIIYVTIHLDYALKGTKWTEDEVEAWDSSHTFSANVDSVTSYATITDPETTMPHASFFFIYCVVILPLIAFSFCLFALLKCASTTAYAKYRKKQEN